MLRAALIAGLFLVTPGLVPGQVPKAPTVEVFGGFSYLNIRSFEGQHYYGLATGVAVNINKHFGIAGDVNLPIGGPSFGFSTASVRPPFRSLPPVLFGRNTTRISTALVGPRFYLRREKVTLFTHALAGVLRTKETEGFSEGLGVRSSFVHSNILPAFGFGGGIDLDVGSRFAARIAQTDYLRARTRAFGWGNQVRLQTGMVVRFGKGSK